MSLNAFERAELKASWQRMNRVEKLRYIWLYYKWPILLAVLAVGIAVNTVYRELTRKEPLLYLGIVNIALGDDLLTDLDAGFVTGQGEDPKRNEVYLYRDLYLSNSASSENHEYAYASRLKVMAAITDEQLDAVLMNREAYDLFSNSGYLLPLPDLLAADPAAGELLSPLLVENTVVLSDNAIDVELGTAAEYEAETERALNGIAVSGMPRLANAGFSGEVYFGVIGNTPRAGTALRYLCWLAQS